MTQISVVRVIVKSMVIFTREVVTSDSNNPPDTTYKKHGHTYNSEHVIWLPEAGGVTYANLHDGSAVDTRAKSMAAEAVSHALAQSFGTVSDLNIVFQEITDVSTVVYSADPLTKEV
jgi:hypothetical protein